MPLLNYYSQTKMAKVLDKHPDVVKQLEGK
jgi:hypothetical protein